LNELITRSRFVMLTLLLTLFAIKGIGLL